jgi:CubicO group peptidase (beta-lactamase class C family)
MFSSLLACLLPLTSLALPPQVNAAALERLRAAAEASKSSTLIVSYDGEIIGEWYFDGPPRLIETQSVTKAVSALVFGAAAGDDALRLLDEPVAKWFPEWRQGRKARIKVRDVLAHTTCLQDTQSSADEVAPAPDAVQLAIAAELDCAPGTEFRYSNKASNLLAGVSVRAFGTPIDVLAETRLFGPLGVRDYIWQRDKAQNPYIMGGLMLTARDMLKIGELVLRRGRWNGSRQFSEAWRGALAQPGPYDHHGLFWWLVRPRHFPLGPKAPAEDGAVVARGWRGQYILVSPSRGLVAVRQYDIRRGTADPSVEFENFERLALDLVRP